VRPSRLPRALTVAECECLLAACKDAELRALVAFLWESGCRVSEALALTWQDVDCDDRSARVTGKGHKQRVVFFVGVFESGGALRLATDGLNDTPPVSLTAHRPQGHFARYADPPCWASCEGTEGRIWARTRQAYSLRLKAAAKRAGIEGMHFHLLRHSFASQMLNNGADLRTVQELMGHVRVDTLAGYWHLADPRLQALRQSIVTGLPRARAFLLSHPDSWSDEQASRLDG
jgi:integrase/recombinase XerD